MVLGAAVWGGTGLAQHQVEQALLLEAVSSYMAARPIQVRSSTAGTAQQAALVHHESRLICNTIMVYIACK